MAYLVKTHALRDGEEERFQTLQQDAFITNPSNDLVGGGINAAANRLVGIRILCSTQKCFDYNETLQSLCLNGRANGL